MIVIGWIVTGVIIACFVISAVIVLGPDPRKWKGGQE